MGLLESSAGSKRTQILPERYLDRGKLWQGKILQAEFRKPEKLPRQSEKLLLQWRPHPV